MPLAAWRAALANENKVGEFTSERRTACQVGFDQALHDANELKDPAFVEQHENPAFARLLDAHDRFVNAKIGNGDVVAATREFREASRAAVAEAKMHDIPVYTAECQRWLAIAQEELDKVKPSPADHKMLAPVIFGTAASPRSG